MEEMYQQYAKPVYYFLLSLSHSPETVFPIPLKWQRN